MSKTTHDDVLDAALAHVETNAAKVVICSQQPASYAEANSTYKLGEKSSPTFGSKADNDGGGGGRMMDMEAFTAGSVTASGTATVVAILSADKVLHTTDLSASQAVTNGNTFSLAAITIRFKDPT